MTATDEFARARDFLLQHRTDYARAYAGFAWPTLTHFNWALDWFDVLAAGNDRPALTLIADDLSVTTRTFSELSASSNQVANALRAWGVRRGDRMLVMLGNELALWEIMLAAIKLGAVLIPCTTQLMQTDLEERITRGKVKHVVIGEAVAERMGGIEANVTRIVVGAARPGFQQFAAAQTYPASFMPDGTTHADDPLLLYFTSGTTARPKLVLHTHSSYPVGHLSTLYWLGLQPGDVHFNISSPGWAKHAWSCFFAPWNAGATVLTFDYKRFDALRTLDVIRNHGVSTLCAPPTVWRMMILADLGAKPAALRELASAGEPLNPEVIERVQKAWGVTIRDGFGQTETTAVVGNPPGQPVVPGSMGRPLPGYDVVLLDSSGREVSEGEIALRTIPRPTGLMVGYLDDPQRTGQAMAGGYYRTGDEATRGADGTLTYLARGDDLFKSSDYRISPFELESALLEHPCVAEAAVVPSPDPVRLAVPKAFVVLKPGFAAGRDTACDLFEFSRTRLAAYKRVRRIEFCDLPKTISGKIRRVELRAIERTRRATAVRAELEFFIEDF